MSWLPSLIPEQVYDPLSLLQIVLVYLGIPLLVVLVVVLLVSAPAWTRQGRHRPGLGWDSDPLLVGSGAPSDATSALDATAARVDEDGSPAETDSPGSAGGSSGRW